MTTLGYLRNTSRRFHTFVANRVAEILDSTNVSQWRHCPGEMNPSDDASRGLHLCQLHPDSRWWRGPDFLRLPGEHWPENVVAKPPAEDVEVKSSITTLFTGSSCFQFLSFFSHFDSLLRAVAWISRFARFMRNKTQCPKGPLLTH